LSANAIQREFHEHTTNANALIVHDFRKYQKDFVAEVFFG